MTVSERAKQFLPFAAVKGLPEALAKKEKVAETKIEMTDELAALLDQKLQQLSKGERVTVTYFNTDRYEKISGEIICLDIVYRTLQIQDTVINFEEIRDIQIG